VRLELPDGRSARPRPPRWPDAKSAAGPGRGARRPGRPGGRLQQQLLVLVVGQQHGLGDAEPFGPGHPARTRPGPAGCGSQPSTLAIVACYETKTENVNTQIDSVQQGYYTSAPLVSVTASIVSQDSA
jgi:hypothetical protein